MSFTLNTYANGDTNYIAKMDADNLAIAAAINAIQAALGTLGGGGASGQLLNALFGASTAFIGNTSYTQGTAGTIITIAGGYAWRPDLGNVLSKSGSTAIDFSGQSAATYYIIVGADGTPARSSSSTGALYSVVWTGSAFGTIAAVAPIVPGGDVAGTYQTLTVVAGAITLAKMANLAANSIIGNNTGSAATPIALTAAQVKTLLAITDADVTFANVSANKVFAGPASGSAAAPTDRSLVIADLGFAGSALGVATLDGSGKVPSSQLPASVVGDVQYQGTWNATTNTPTLASGIGTQGYYYKVATAGTTAIDGISQWNLGDSIIFDGATWDKIDGLANEVISVAGRTGAVVIASGDVSGLAASATTDTTNASNISSGSLALARIATIAASTILGNNGGGAAVPAALTAAQVKTLLAIASGDVSGLAASATTDTTNASNISSGTLNAARLPAIRFDIPVCFPGVPTASQTVTYVAGRAITIPHTAPGSAKAGTASGATATFTIKQNGSSVGTLAFSTSATGAFTVSSDITLAAGDLLQFIVPASPDSTLADIGITLTGTA